MSYAQETTLLKVVTAGFIDQVAKKVPLGIITEGSKLQKRCSYMACAPKFEALPLVIHPTSFLFSTSHEQLPEFITYKEIVVSHEKSFMSQISEVQPAWLAEVATVNAQVSFSKPLEVPPPIYDAVADRVKCYVTPFFGHQRWSLPLHTVEFPQADNAMDNMIKYRWFARYLVEGKVVPELGAITPHLSSGSVLITGHSSYSKKVQNLVRPLVTAHVCTRAALFAKLGEDKYFLFKALKTWLDPAFHAQLQRIWTQVGLTARASLQK
jgi:ATP-dependent RNA helicase DHX37/DHR1